MPLLAFVLLSAFQVSAQDIKLPEQFDPPRLVSDYAGLLSPDDAAALETRLVQYNKETSTDFAIVIIPTLDGADRAQYATELMHAWGIGQKGKDNGVLLLIAKEDRSMFLGTGRGVEGALPDAICKRITENTIKPQFKAGNYAAGINAGVDEVEARLKGEFKSDDQPGKFKISWIIIAIIIIIILFSFFGGGNNGRTYSSSGSSIPWFLLGALSSGGRSSGGDSWGSSDGGGFGGFGGGDSGGGGAGSNW